MSQPNQSSGSNVQPDWMMLALNAHHASLHHRCPACSWDPMGEEHHRCKWIAAVKAVAEAMPDSGQWPAMRPMSEAPKDGTRVLAFLKDSGGQAFRVLHYRDCVWWVTAAWFYSEEQIAGWWPLPEVPRG